TRESKRAPPSSMIRQGTFPSGLYCWMVESCAQTLSRTNSYSSFFSARTIRVLRTYGLVNEPISFMATFEGWGRAEYSRRLVLAGAGKQRVARGARVVSGSQGVRFVERVGC